MSKKLMLLAAGVLSALALTALPSAASAGPLTNDCTKLPCTYTITSNTVAKLSTVGGKTVECTSFSGVGSQAALSATSASAQLTFSGCKELNTGFKFPCTGKEQASGVIKTNAMTADYVWLDKLPEPHGVAGLLMTGVNTTFVCAGFQNFTVTGDVIGELEETATKCTTASNTQKLNFESLNHGVQKWTRFTTAGTVFSLDSNNDAGGAYEATAQSGTGTVTWNQAVRLTGC